jgi:hypothetical protein
MSEFEIIDLGVTTEERKVLEKFRITNKNVKSTKISLFTTDDYASHLRVFLSYRGCNTIEQVEQVIIILLKLIEHGKRILGGEEAWISLRCWPDYAHDYRWHRDIHNPISDRACVMVLKGPGTMVVDSDARFNALFGRQLQVNKAKFITDSGMEVKQVEQYRGLIFKTGENGTIHSEPYQEEESQRMIIRMECGEKTKVDAFKKSMNDRLG